MLNQFLEEQIHYYQQYVKGIEKGSGIDIESLNTLFRDMLFEAYEKSTSKFVLFLFIGMKKTDIAAIRPAKENK